MQEEGVIRFPSTSYVVSVRGGEERGKDVLLADGGFRHGQVNRATEQDGGHLKERPVTPGDLAATIYHHFGVPQDTVYVDPTGRPIPVVQEDGKPITEMI